jgi:hypothetical protein
VGIGESLGGGGALTQIFTWQIAAQIITSLMNPTLTLVAARVNEANPVADLSPADLANAVVQSYIDHGDAAHQAARSGVGGDKFSVLVDLAGDALAPDALAEALRRGIIPEGGRGAGSTSFEQGIAEGRLKNKWAATVKELATKWPTPADALDALLKGQVSYDEGVALYTRFGGDPQYFSLLYNTVGNAPTPVEALEMANRGIIPWTGRGADVVSYEQAFLEGPWRNKWESPYRAIGEYLPPPRTVTAMVGNGSITEAEALSLLIKQGLTKDLAAAYVHDAQNSKSGKERELTVAQLLDMYGAGLIKADDARNLLVALKYSADSADELLAYKDLQRAIAAVNQAVARIHTLYVSHKITQAVAANGLNALKIPADQISTIVATWDIERAVNVRTLTAAEIADAWYEEIIGQDEALAELVALGYTPRDAWIRLSIKAKGKLPNAPDQGPAPIGPTPLTGGST